MLLLTLSSRVPSRKEEALDRWPGSSARRCHLWQLLLQQQMGLDQLYAF